MNFGLVWCIWILIWATGHFYFTDLRLQESDAKFEQYLKSIDIQNKQSCKQS